MAQQRRGRNTGSLLAMLMLAVGYAAAYRMVSSGNALLDGALGVGLGLYICSHPAANAVDLLFYNRDGGQRATPTWLALNLAVILAGWLVIVLGATRLVGRDA